MCQNVLLTAQWNVHKKLEETSVSDPFFLWIREKIFIQILILGVSGG